MMLRKVITRNAMKPAMRLAMTVIMLTASVMMMWGQEMNKKFSMTTKMFVNELQAQKQQAAGTHRATVRHLPDGRELPKPQRLIASPDTIGGVAYISCFIHLSDPGDLSAVRALGVRVQETFDGLDFITASVPVSQLNALADVDNVTKIKVARLMRPTTDVARKKTNAYDLLTQSSLAASMGVNSQYDGTGVVLGVIDTGIDFQHIAFRDKDGNSRVKWAYLYNGSGPGVEYTDPADIAALTTDDATQDHGTHTSSIAGGSSVIVNKTDKDHFTVTVTDDHASATYGGMAPGADLYLAAVKDMEETEMANAIKKLVEYADNEGKPLVMSNSWGSSWGARKGTGLFSSVVSQYFGDSYPNHIVLFASGNDAGLGTAEGGGYFVKKDDASQASPLGTIIRTPDAGGDAYSGNMFVAYAEQPINCELYVLDNCTGAVLMSMPFTEDTTIDDISVTVGETTTTCYNGKLGVTFDTEYGDHFVCLSSEDGLTATAENAYTLAVRIYPANAEATAEINMWSCGLSYFTNTLTTEGITWTNGTDDMCVSNETTIPDAISVGAYVSRRTWGNYDDIGYSFGGNAQGDIAYFSSYATAEMSPLGMAYPWITAPGSVVVAGVNHFHTTGVDENSYFGEKKQSRLVVNNVDNPYGAMQGTSMATPVAAGIVALWLQAVCEHGKTLTVNQVKEIMRVSAVYDEYTTTGPNASHFGNGKVNALLGISILSRMIDDATGIININEEPGSLRHTTTGGQDADSAWYTLSGMRLVTQPTKPGLYIRNGKVYVPSRRL